MRCLKLSFIFSYIDKTITITGLQLVEVGGRSPLPVLFFENRVVILGKKCPDCVHQWDNFHLYVIMLF